MNTDPADAPTPLWAACLPSRPDAAPVAAALAALAPTVAPLQDGWVAELTRTQRLFGGRVALLRRLQATLAPLGWARLGVAPTARAALALAHTAPAGGGLRHALPPRWPQALLALPPRVLPEAAAHAPTLQALGLRTLGALHAVGDGLAARTDPALPRALRQCLGEEPLALEPWRAPPEWHGEQALPDPTSEAAALAFAAQRLLQPLQAWLRARQLGVLRWALGWPGQPQALVFTHREPVQDAARLLRLLRERLQRLTLAQPVETLVLHTLQLAPWRARSAALLPGAAGDDDGASWAAVLERLSARLGPQRVCRADLRATWQPGEAGGWRPLTDDGAAEPTLAALPPDAAWQPPWWLPQDRVLAGDAQGRPLWDGQPLRRLHGPLRRQADGPAQPVQACLALDAHGQPWWVERQGRAPWRLRGVYG